MLKSCGGEREQCEVKPDNKIAYRLVPLSPAFGSPCVSPSSREEMAGQHYCLRWNNYQSNMTSVFHHLLRTQAFVDVTLACNEHSLKAHKVVLSACSSYFQKLLLENPCKHPTIIMPQDVCFTDLKFIIEFVYRGEIDVSQAELQSLLKTADQLKIKGLCEVEEGKESLGAEVTPLPPVTPSRRALSRQRRLMRRRTARSIQYRERMKNRPGNHNQMGGCIELQTSQIEDRKDLINAGNQVVVVEHSQGLEATAAAIMMTSPANILPPALPPTQTPHQPLMVDTSNVRETDDGATPQGPTATLVTTMDIQTDTHRDIAVDATGLDVEDNNVKVKFETLRAIDQPDHMEMEHHHHITDRAVQAVTDDDHAMHTMMITPELLGLIPSSSSSQTDEKIVDSNGGGSNGSEVIGGGLIGHGGKPGGKSWTQEDMEAALEALRTQRMSLTKASLHYGIPSTTLWQRAHRLGIDTPKKDGPAKSWTEDSLNIALDALRSGTISANKASKAYGIPSSTLYKIARREGIRLAAPFNAAPTTWNNDDLERALEAIRSGQTTVQRAATEFGIPSGTLYGRCKREGIELSRNNPTPWSEDAMTEALEAVRVGQMSINQAAIHYNLPYSSLYGRFKRVKYEGVEGGGGGGVENGEGGGMMSGPPPPQEPPPQIMLVQYQQTPAIHMYQA